MNQGSIPSDTETMALKQWIKTSGHSNHSNPHWTLQWVAITKTSVGKDVKSREALYTVGKSVNWYGHSGQHTENLKWGGGGWEPYYTTVYLENISEGKWHQSATHCPQQPRNGINLNTHWATNDEGWRKLTMHTHSGIQKEKPSVHEHMVEPEGHYARWNDTERRYCIISHISSLKELTLFQKVEWWWRMWMTK